MAKQDIYDIIQDLARQRKGIIFVSSELPELIIGVLTNMLRLENVDANVEMMVKAVIIILAVAIQKGQKKL